MNLIDSIVKWADDIQRIRHDLHAHPELRFEEARTAAVVVRTLSQWGIRCHQGIGGYGVVGVVEKGTSARAIGLRADMDALPIEERNTFDHQSRHAGRMHACGHDGHTAMLLAAARYLVEEADFDGTVYLIFQPAEEGGGCGADRMIKDGLFERFPMSAVYGMHNWPGLATGVFGVRPGAMMASSNVFDLTITGVGSHAAQPHKSVDPIIIATHIVQAWQTVVSRNTDPNDGVVLSVTQIHAGSATNIISDSAYLNGTVRTFSRSVLDIVETRMRTLATSIAAGFDATVSFDFKRNYPPLCNDAEHTALALGVMRDIVGDNAVDADIAPTMGAEDFSFMLQAKPGCYVFLGNGEQSAALHSGRYDFNDALIPIGASYWVRLAQTALTACRLTGNGV